MLMRSLILNDLAFVPRQWSIAAIIAVETDEEAEWRSTG